MSSWTGKSRHSAGGDDGKQAEREPDAGMVCECGGHEHHPAREPSGVRVGVNDSTWGKHGACVVYRTCPGGADGM